MLLTYSYYQERGVINIAKSLYKPEDEKITALSYEQIRDFHKQNLHEMKKGQYMTASSYNGENYWNQINNLHVAMDLEYLYRDSLTAGMRIEYPHGIVLQQSARSSFFRGENQIYDDSVPTLLRKLNNDYKDDSMGQTLYRIVADMRIYEFKCLIEQFDYVKKWTECDVLYDVLAQHYGLETCWMDMSNDFDVALFFACCYYDSNKKVWKPLTKEQTEQKEETQYGIIYHVPSQNMTIRWAIEMQKFSGCSNEVAAHEEGNIRHRLYKHPKYSGPVQNLIYPIGFQPFMRCSMQNGYAIYMREFQPLQEDKLFRRLMFRHSEELSKRIFDYMDGGEKIYPHEGLNKIQFLIDQINTSTDFSYDAFQYALYRSHKYSLAMKEKCLEDLRHFTVDGKNITIRKDVTRKLSSGKRKQINQDYADFSLQKEYRILPMERRIIPAGANMFAPYMLPGKDDTPSIVDFQSREMSGCMNLWAMIQLRLIFSLKYKKIPKYM